MDWLTTLLGLDLDELAWHHMMFRGILVFLLAMIFIRMSGMRSFGTRAPVDVVLSITIGGILSRCITGHYPFFACLGAALTLAVCHRLVAFLCCKFDSVRRTVEGQSVLLYDKEGLKSKSIVKYSIQLEDLNRALREQGLKDWSQVLTISYEVDGKISVVKK
jgi:uncharacterized membrane protein YcaP (DUF421 family)